MEDSNRKGSGAMYVKFIVRPLEPQKILPWFSLLETQFELACITSDKLKSDILTENLEHQYLELVTDIMNDPSVTDRYEKLKSELIKELADPNDAETWKLLEEQKFKDKTPSQFYKDLKSLGSTLTSDDLVPMLWINRLPRSVQRVLDVAKEMDENALTEIADRVYEIWLETERIAAVSAKQTTAVSKRSNCASDTLHDRVSRLEAQTGKLTIGCCRPTSLQKPGLCHRTLSDCANKCHYPCNWNQKQENPTQSFIIATYDIDKWGSIYVRDTVSDLSFLVDTGAARSTFPRKLLPAYANQIKDEHYYLIADNGTRIDTYGPTKVHLNLGCNWQFTWQFVVADVIEPIIGIDFMQHHGFLVDTRNKCLFKPAEPTYEVLCHGCHWGIGVPHKPNPCTAPIPKLTSPPPSGSGRGRIPNAVAPLPRLDFSS